MGRPAGDEIHGPEIRIVEVVQHGHVEPGAVVHAQVKMKHPNRTGLELVDGKFVQRTAPFHLRELEILYGRERVSRFALTAALSDDPFIGFTLLARREDTLAVRLVNTRGQEFRASQRLRFS